MRAAIVQLYLDGIVTVVDTKHLARHLDEKKADGACNESQMQVAFADFIMLNKQVGVATSPCPACHPDNSRGMCPGPGDVCRECSAGAQGAHHQQDSPSGKDHQLAH